MTTVKQIERLWTAKMHHRLLRELFIHRPESAFGLDTLPACATAAAAMAIIRLDELNQRHVPIYTKLVHTLLARQERDGGWGDVMTTALALRALLAGGGEGEAISRGMKYLADLQQPGGAWPRIAIRRMPADAVVCAFVLYELADEPRFREAVRIADAMRWFDENHRAFEAPVQKLWNYATLRCRGKALHAPQLNWS